MRDIPAALLIVGALSMVAVFVTAALVSEHTTAKLPRGLTGKIRRVPRRSLLIELPWVLLILGGGEIVVAMFLLHPNSTAPVRLLAALQLLGISLWGLYLLGRIREARSKPK
jgi:hypothetical protein